jgi:uncharacterized protein (TIGR02680 family)
VDRQEIRHGANGSSPSDGGRPARWQLNRAGIVNVYQYENETLHFGGGRLLLRGVNGSGKSTAMNMLLPFLLTARERRIDAAGEQTGVLRSWMLSGRDEPQPVGYLWLELRKGRDHLTCGCGLRANRSTDRVTTWWFVTDRRPGIDFALVESGAPLSADALKAVVGAGEVFANDRRPDYREAIRRRLFGGADLDQHLGLLDVVRSPRVGDRIDVELPDHLARALPELSDQALTEAAHPLDQLDEHRRNVADLDATTAALGAIADVYRRYALAELHRHVAAGRKRVGEAARCRRDESRHRREAEAAGRRQRGAAGELERLGAEQVRLDREISALRDSPIYREGQQLDDLRSLVSSLDRRHREQLAQQEKLAARETATAAAIGGAEARTDTASQAVVASLADLGRRSAEVHLTARPPVAPPVDRSALTAGGTEVRVPAGELESRPMRRALGQVVAATKQRESEVADVRGWVDAVDEARRELDAAETDRDRRRADADEAEGAFATARAALAGAGAAWDAAVSAWAAEAEPHLAGSTVPAAHIRQLARSHRPIDDSVLDRAATRQVLLGEIETLVVHCQREAAVAERELADAQAAAASAQAVVDELAERSEPDPPVLAWQHRTSSCLADLVDFADHLSQADRAGLEAALEASGLLAATVEDGGLRLDTGELVVVPASPVANPLGGLLTITVPELDVRRLDPGLVAKVLDSISVDPRSDSPTVAATDGSFRAGALRGRHAKAEAEHIGVTARKAALERLRAEAAEALAVAGAALLAAEQHLTTRSELRAGAESLRRSLPALDRVERAQDRAEDAEASLAIARERHAAARQLVADADRAHAERSGERDRVAATAQLPADRAGLDRVEATLREVRFGCEQAGQHGTTLELAFEAWREAVERWREAERDLGEASRGLDRAAGEHAQASARLATLEDSIGLPYRELVASIAHADAERDRARQAVPGAQAERDAAVAARAEADAQVHAAEGRRREAEEACSAHLGLFRRVLGIPGLLAAVSLQDETAGPTAVEATADGLGRLLDELTSALPAPGDDVTADGVRVSLRQRRDALGAGWDAEDRQPDPSLPLAVHVNGPIGQMPLAESLVAARTQLARQAALLTEEQDQALRALLQGLVAQEVAEKLHQASELIGLMNGRLRSVTTAHGVGVELRWRRSADLDEATRLMIDLLAKLPDLRTADEELSLRHALSAKLDEARRLDPDLPYRDLIGRLLDYRQWYDMAVLVRRDGSAPVRLTRRTPLSEGEKKLVTYLPLFAAVAASCDALRERAPDLPRFVLLDDAFAKVSEDNHAHLFGLLVDLDLDVIATSERLWGTHATVPELAITEVIRDAGLGVILLEHSFWDGYTLTRTANGHD